MDWGIIAQVNTLVIIALLAFPITIIVRAAALSASALSKVRERQATLQQHWDEIKRERMGLLGQTLDEKLKVYNKKQIGVLYKSIRKWGKQLRQHEKDLRSLSAAVKQCTPSFILFHGGVCPLVLLIAAVITSAFAWSLTGTDLFLPLGYWFGTLYKVYVNHFLLILSAIFSVLGLCFGIKVIAK